MSNLAPATRSRRIGWDKTWRDVNADLTQADNIGSLGMHMFGSTFGFLVVVQLSHVPRMKLPFLVCEATVMLTVEIVFLFAGLWQ